MASMSYFHKPRGNCFDHRTVPQLLDENAVKFPEKESIVFYDENKRRSSLTFQQLKEQSIQLASSLASKLGLKSGDRFLLYSPNCLEFVVCWMALNRLGILAVLMSPNIIYHESKASIFKRLKCNGLISGLHVPEVQRERIVKEILEITEERDTAGEPYARVIITIGKSSTDINHPQVLEYENLIQENNNAAELINFQYKVDADDRAFVLFTSGSTGPPKAVVYTHHNIINSVNLLTPGMSVDHDKRLISQRPLSTSRSAPILMRAIIVGFTCVTTVINKFTMKDSFQLLFDIVAAEKCSGCSIPQQHVHELLAQNFQDKHDLSSIKTWGFGSQVVPRKTIQALLDAFPQKRAILVYAATEILAVGIKMISPASITNKEDHGKINMNAGIEVKVVGEDGLIVPLGTKGEIHVRSPKTFREYLEDPEETLKVKEPTGWVHTRDYGVMYEGGKLKILGRNVDLIDVAGSAVFAVEVEEVLLEHPDVQDVVAVGVPNKDQKEDICACIIEVPGSNLEGRANEFQKWCDVAFDANNNNGVPRPAHFQFLKEFPIANSAKIDRAVIKCLAKESIQAT